MELYRLSYDYNRIDVFDEFESFIWSERYSEYGDFEIVAKPSAKVNSFFARDTILMHSESDRVMQVEYMLTKRDDSGRTLTTIKGKSFEYVVLESRTTTINRDTPPYKLKVQGNVGQIACSLVDMVCVNPTEWHYSDIFPHLGVKNLSNSPFRRFEIPQQSLYTAIKDICDSDRVGFRITVQPTAPRLLFSAYKGVRRSQLVFGAFLDNMSDESFLYSRENLKNVAYVWSKDARRRRVVLAPWANGVTPVGLSRRVLNVNATDVDPTEMTQQELDETLTQKGLEALAGHTTKLMMDGQLAVRSDLKYGSDYKLGDLVTIYTPEGTRQESMITEYIWVYDSQGLRSYPTFTAIE